MRIVGAVLEVSGRDKPYATSRPISVGDVELADPGSGEVQVRIEAAGLCHSDLSVVDGTRPRPTPMLLGHEAAGRIHQVGDDVNDFTLGDRVVLTFLPRCGSCEGCATNGIRPCLPGSAANSAGTLLGGYARLTRGSQTIHHHLGASAFASHAVVNTRSLVKIAEDVPVDIAAVLGCAVLTGGGAIVNVAKPVTGSRVIVVGLGGVGIAAVLTALAHDDVEVIAVDMVSSKLEVASALGAQTYTPDEISARGLQGAAVIEAAGSAKALELAISLTEPGGKTISVGLPAPDARISLSPTALVAEGRSLIGSYLGSAVPQRDIPVFVEMWRSGRLPLEKLISSHLSLGEINEGLDVLANGEAIRQIITF